MSTYEARAGFCKDFIKTPMISSSRLAQPGPGPFL